MKKVKSEQPAQSKFDKLSLEVNIVAREKFSTAEVLTVNMDHVCEFTIEAMG